MDFGFAKVKYALFKGIEQEGPNKGVDTLFVVGDVPLIEILGHAGTHNIQSIYFGAGGRFDYNPETVLKLASVSITCKYVTIESPIFSHILFKKLRYANSNASWIIPYIWHGEILETGFRHIKQLGISNYGAAAGVYVKADLKETVIISRLSDTHINRYDVGYDKDKLLMQKER